MKMYKFPVTFSKKKILDQKLGYQVYFLKVFGLLQKLKMHAVFGGVVK